MDTPNTETAASDAVYATLNYGNTYRVMGLAFEKGKPLPVNEKQKAYLKTLKHSIDVTVDDRTTKEQRPLFRFSDEEGSDAGARRRARG